MAWSAGYVANAVVCGCGAPAGMIGRVVLEKRVASYTIWGIALTYRTYNSCSLFFFCSDPALLTAYRSHANDHRFPPTVRDDLLVGGCVFIVLDGLFSTPICHCLVFCAMCLTHTMPPRSLFLAYFPVLFLSRFALQVGNPCPHIDQIPMI